MTENIPQVDDQQSDYVEREFRKLDTDEPSRLVLCTTHGKTRTVMVPPHQVEKIKLVLQGKL